MTSKNGTLHDNHTYPLATDVTGYLLVDADDLAAPTAYALATTPSPGLHRGFVQNDASAGECPLIVSHGYTFVVPVVAVFRGQKVVAAAGGKVTPVTAAAQIANGEVVATILKDAAADTCAEAYASIS